MQPTPTTGPAHSESSSRAICNPSIHCCPCAQISHLTSSTSGWLRYAPPILPNSAPRLGNVPQLQPALGGRNEKKQFGVARAFSSVRDIYISLLNAAKAETRMPMKWSQIQAVATVRGRATLASLPAPLEARARALPIRFEQRPNRSPPRGGHRARYARPVCRS